MRKNLTALVVSVSLGSALALPFRLAAQEEKKEEKSEEKSEHHHYKLVDIGTLGGPNSFFSGPILQI